jgi:glycosyltransferase involved in cell wall biosynthesis
LPVYNGGNLVKECVQSILSQTYKDFDLIVLDNCSIDGTLDYLNSLNDLRIKIELSDKNIGIVENWGKILKIKKNEFITLIGHDDILQNNYLEEINKLIELHPTASLYQTHYNYIDVNGKFMKPCKPMASQQNVSEFIACQMAQTNDSMGTGYMMRSKDFDMIGGMPQDYPNLIFADYELWVKLTKINYKATSENFCFEYRIHNSVSKNTNGEEYALAFEKYIYFIHSLLGDKKIKNIVENYGYNFLVYFCESLSHRILKTSTKKRNIKVNDFIKKCTEWAQLIIPDKKFVPQKIFRINIAKKIDNNFISSYLFRKFKSF